VTEQISDRPRPIEITTHRYRIDEQADPLLEPGIVAAADHRPDRQIILAGPPTQQDPQAEKRTTKGVHSDSRAAALSDTWDRAIGMALATRRTSVRKAVA
jgi:hypothetical protein